LAIAVRRPDGNLDVTSQRIPSLYKGKIREIPFIRGFIVLVETLVLGIKALFHSARLAMPDEEEEQLSAPMLWGSMALGIIFAVGVFFIIPLLLTRFLIDPFIASSIVSNLLEGIIRIVLFVSYLWLIGLLPDIKRVFAYHGAEHMTVNAYEDDVPLDVEAIKEYSTAHARCGTSFLLVVLVIAIIVFALLGRPNIWLSIISRIVLLPVIAAIGYEFVRFAGAHSKNALVHILLTPGLFLQSLSTRPPDDSQLETAVSALKRVIEEDESSRVDHQDVQITSSDSNA
jgi:uncharacterized protein YqhQ